MVIPIDFNIFYGYNIANINNWIALIRGGAKYQNQVDFWFWLFSQSSSRAEFFCYKNCWQGKRIEIYNYSNYSKQDPIFQISIKSLGFGNSLGQLEIRAIRSIFFLFPCQ